MDFIKRKVFLTKNLRPLDTNGDGVFNALVLSATTKTIQVPLRHSYDDMGIFEVSDDEDFEIIDVGGLFDDSITGITQPTPPPSLTGITWNGGGSVGNGGSNDTEISYCNDTTAQSYSVLSYNSFGTEAILTPNIGTPTTYLAPIPKFTIDNSLCKYDPVFNEPGSGQGSSASDNVSDIQCKMSCPCAWAANEDGDCGIHSGCPACDWTTLSWNSYKSTALSNANAHCQTMYGFNYTSTLTDSDFVNGSTTIPQGNANTTQPFAGVSLKNHWDGQCCITRNDDGSCAKYLVRNRYEYCFYCKK
jgi:hypothetical protein